METFLVGLVLGGLLVTALLVLLAWLMLRYARGGLARMLEALALSIGEQPCERSSEPEQCGSSGCSQESSCEANTPPPSPRSRRS